MRIQWRRRDFIGGIVLLAAALSDGQTIIEPLWPNRIPPGSVSSSLTDTLHNPAVTVFLPPAHLANGAAVVIFPGGGYIRMSSIREGRNVALKMNTYGVTAFLVRYRVGITSGTGPYQHPVEMWDGQRAIRWVRANAARFNVDPGRIGIAGFSAGGHLASTVATHYDAGSPPVGSINRHSITPDSVDAVSCRPDFQILLYPVINMDASFTHAGSRIALLGTSPSASLLTLLSNEKQVTSQTPPAFLVHTLNDGTVPVKNSQAYSDSLQARGVARKLVLFPAGTHGFGLADGQDAAPNYADVQKWPDSCALWMQNRGYLTPTSILPAARREAGRGSGGYAVTLAEPWGDWKSWNSGRFFGLDGRAVHSKKTIARLPLIRKDTPGSPDAQP